MSRIEFYFHIVWATKRRQPFLMGEKEEAVFRCALKLVKAAGYEALAINGMPDHVHLLIKTGPKFDVSALMKNLKGVTSALVNDMTDHAGNFRWQEGYFAKSVTPSHLPKVLDYVKGQKEHHPQNKTYPQWEETGEESSPEI